MDERDQWLHATLLLLYLTLTDPSLCSVDRQRW